MCNLECKFCCNYVLKQRPLPSHSSVHQCNSHHIIYLDIPEEKPLLDKHKSSYLYFYMIIRNIWSSLRHPQILAISNRKNIHIQTPKKSTQGQAFIFLWLLLKTRTELFPINRTFLPSSLYLSSRTGDLYKGHNFEDTHYHLNTKSTRVLSVTWQHATNNTERKGREASLIPNYHCRYCPTSTPLNRRGQLVDLTLADIPLMVQNR